MHPLLVSLILSCSLTQTSNRLHAVLVGVEFLCVSIFKRLFS
jgi:hypothetical protein